MAVQLRQQPTVRRHLVSLEEFDRMVEAGVFETDTRVELIRGDIVDMSPVGDRNVGTVMLLDSLLQARVGKAALVLVQSPVRMPDDTKPYPDLCLLKWRSDYYIKNGPTSNDLLLVIEVSDSSLDYDLSTKKIVYAEASVPMYWVIDLRHNVIQIFEDPANDGYQQSRTVRRGEALALPDGIEGTISVSEVLS